MAKIIPFPQAAAAWTQAEHDALCLLAVRLSAAITFGAADGAPWAVFELPLGGSRFSVVRERGRVAVLDEQGKCTAEAGTVAQVVKHLETQ